MAACIPQRFAGYRSHVIYSVALCFSCIFLLIPQVFNVFMYFSPLLLSTALFVTAFLSLRSFISSTEPEHGDTYYVQEEFPQVAEEQHVNTISDIHVENTCFIQCVRELHENGILLVESMFKMDMSKQSNKEMDEDNHQLNVQRVVDPPKKENSTLEAHEQ
ncbi:hypothetical protein SUGI_0348290 [Cryptomeria japonica]|nr:hypothetical protein SUGI_0348290 [Cryptomeria japonica]